MLITTLIFLAAGQTESAAVAARFQAFMTAHPVFSVDCAISGTGGSGSGEITLRRAADGTVKAEWKAKIGRIDYRFTTDGSLGLEVVPLQHVYDRTPTVDRPFPEGRINDPFGYPYPLVAGQAPFFGTDSNTTLTHKGALTELKLAIHTMQGDTVVIGDFAADGRMMYYDAAKGSAGRLSHEIVQFSNYRFGTSATPSDFDTNPPIGYSAYAFDVPPSVLPGLAPVPNVPLTGPSAITLAKLGAQPKALLVFVDDPMPEGLLASLERLSAKTPVAAIALAAADVNVGSIPLYRTNDAGFDEAGIRATPQFYFVSGGKVVQAWSGFQEEAAAKFEAEVLAYIQKR